MSKDKSFYSHVLQFVEDEGYGTSQVILMQYNLVCPTYASPNAPPDPTKFPFCFHENFSITLNWVQTQLKVGKHAVL